MKRLAVVMTACVLGLAWMLTSAALPKQSVSRASRVAVPVALPAVPVTAPGGLTTLTPSRLLDTRAGLGAAPAPVAASGTVHLQVTGRGGVPPSGVSAVVLSVEVTSPTNVGFVTVYPDGGTLPNASNLNFPPDQTVRNLVFAPVGANGQVALHNASKGTIQLVADVSGYYLAGTPTVAGAFAALAPSRLLDTRAGAGPTKTAVAAHGTVHLQVTGRGGVPASGVSAAVLNVTAMEPSASGNVTVYQDGTVRPQTANLSFAAAETVPNLVVVPVGMNGQVDLYNGSDGTVQLVADVSGYFRAGDPAVAGAFGVLAPSRLLDARSGLGSVAAGGTVHLQVTGRGGVPASGVSAVVLNIVATAPSSSGYVSAYADGSTAPRKPNLSFLPGQPAANLVVVPVSANGKVAVYNGSVGSIQLVVDIAGYYKLRDKVTMVSTGTSHSCAVTAGGAVKCWGYNAFGELGNATTTSSVRPVDVVGLGSGMVAASAGLSHTCALTSAAGVKCWGDNRDGQLGDGSTSRSAVPVDVVGLGAGAVAVSAGWSHSCAVTTAGGVKCWGRNSFGELGDNTTADSTVPVDVVGLGSGVVAVGVGEFHSCARTAAGAVKCWGYNVEGELGDGTMTQSAVPVSVYGLGSGVIALSVGGYHSCAVTTAGAVKCWGHDPHGELGDGTTADSAIPVDVLGIGARAVSVSAGWSHSCAVTAAGAVSCWGGGGGEPGAGNTNQSADPVSVVGLRSGAVAVSAGWSHSCAVTTAGAVRCWGYSAHGELGAGTATNSAVPVDVFGLE